MALPSKRRLANKGIKILFAEMRRLETTSKERSLNSFEIGDVIKMIKAMETQVKDDKPVKGETNLTEQQQKRAYEMLKQKFESTDSENDSE